MLLPPCLSGFKKLQQSSDRTEWLIPRTEWHVYLLCLRSGWRLPFLDCGMVPIIHTLRVPRSPGAPVCPRVSKGGIHAFPHWLRGLYRAPWRKLTMVAVPGKIGSIVPSSLGVDSLRCICREWWCCFWRSWWAERGFPGGTSGKEPTCQCRRCKMCVRSLGWEDSPGGGLGHPLQYSYLEKPMDRGAWQATVHRVEESWTWLKQLSMHAHMWRERSEGWCHLLPVSATFPPSVAFCSAMSYTHKLL